MTKYYTLVTKDADGRWSPQFGDYVRSVVKEELAHYRESYGYKRDELKIIETSSERQQEINHAINSLNYHFDLQHH